jgi:NADH:ubiquinone oxidoreductase subunit 4 (subunit M)
MLGSFVGEFLILLGTFTGVSKSWAIAATLGVILGAAYMLWLVQRLFFGPESTLAASKPPDDLRLGQLAVLWPMSALMLAMGLAPMLWLSTIEKGAHPPMIPSGAKFLVDDDSYIRGLKPPPLSGLSISAARIATTNSMIGEGQR